MGGAQRTESIRTEITEPIALILSPLKQSNRRAGRNRKIILRHTNEAYLCVLIQRMKITDLFIGCCGWSEDDAFHNVAATTGKQSLKMSTTDLVAQAGRVPEMDHGNCFGGVRLFQNGR